MFLFECNKTHLIHYAELQKRSTFSAKEINNVEKMSCLHGWVGVYVLLSHLFVIKIKCASRIISIKELLTFFTKALSLFVRTQVPFCCWLLILNLFQRSQNIIFKENKHLIRMPNEVKTKNNNKKQKYARMHLTFKQYTSCCSVGITIILYIFLMFIFLKLFY